MGKKARPYSAPHVQIKLRSTPASGGGDQGGPGYPASEAPLPSEGWEVWAPARIPVLTDAAEAWELLSRQPRAQASRTKAVQGPSSAATPRQLQKSPLGGHLEGSDMRKRKFPPRPMRLRPGYLSLAAMGQSLPQVCRKRHREKILLAKVVRAGISACAVHYPDTSAGPRHFLILPAGGTSNCWWLTLSPSPGTALSWKELTPHPGSVITAKSA